MNRIFYLLLALLCTTAVQGAGLITLHSAHDVATTTDRLEEQVTQAGFRVIARVDHAAAARGVELALRPTQLLLFGKPQAGSLLMQQAQSIGIDLPMKYLVWEDENGQVLVGWNDPVWLANRHGVKGEDKLLAKMSGALQDLAGKAAAD